METVSPNPVRHWLTFFCFSTSRPNWHIHLGTTLIARGSICIFNNIKVRTLSEYTSASRILHYMHRLRITSLVNSWVARLLCLLPYVPFSAKVVKGELLRLCFRLARSNTSVEKAENWLSWCGESWSAIRRLIKSLAIFSRITRRTGFFQSCV